MDFIVLSSVFQAGQRLADSLKSKYFICVYW